MRNLWFLFPLALVLSLWSRHKKSLCVQNDNFFTQMMMFSFKPPFFELKKVVKWWLFNDDLRVREREEKRTRNFAPLSHPGVISKSTRSHSGVIPKSFQSHPEVISKSSSSHPAVIQQSSSSHQSYTKIIQESCQSRQNNKRSHFFKKIVIKGSMSKQKTKNKIFASKVGNSGIRNLWIHVKVSR